MAEQKLWTREELILDFKLYLKLTFGKLHTRTPEVIKLAKITGRTVNSIAIRLTNFASCDPYHQNRGVKGMVGGIKQCQPIWDEFIKDQEDLVFTSEQILAEKEHTSIDRKYKDLLTDINGKDVIRQVKTRVNQSVFRQMILTNYNNKCAITGIDIPKLLLASHIVPWSVNEKERLNPENGLCLSALYDKAFDKGLISINHNYEVLISNELKSKSNTSFYHNNFGAIEKIKLTNPLKYFPKKEFLEYHLDEIFQK
ncbi:MAG: HNH endonuclease, partial [Bacteroidetes bacterium]|nr:HNH endonuclease [Bacteroidota bacterium]